MVSMTDTTPAKAEIHTLIHAENADEQVNQIRDEGRLTPDDEASIRQAESEAEKASAYGGVLRVFAECLAE